MRHFKCRIGGICGQTISTILALWVPCPWENIAGSFSYRKLWFLGLKHITPECSQNKILAVKNLGNSVHTSVFGDVMWTQFYHNSGTVTWGWGHSRRIWDASFPFKWALAAVWFAWNWKLAKLTWVPLTHCSDLDLNHQKTRHYFWQRFYM